MEAEEARFLPTCRHAGDGALAWTVVVDVSEEKATQMAAYRVHAPDRASRLAVAGRLVTGGETCISAFALLVLETVEGQVALNTQPIHYPFDSSIIRVPEVLQTYRLALGSQKGPLFSVRNSFQSQRNEKHQDPTEQTQNPHLRYHVCE